MFKRRTPTSLAALFALFLVAPGLRGQEAGERNAENALRALVTKPAPADRDRRVILDFLDRTDVRGVAASNGIDVELLKKGVSTLDAEGAQELSTRVQDTQDQLDMVGGDTFVISSTVVIIILLVLILVAVA